MFIRRGIAIKNIKGHISISLKTVRLKMLQLNSYMEQLPPPAVMKSAAIYERALASVTAAIVMSLFLSIVCYFLDTHLCRRVYETNMANVKKTNI